ncbi:tRNA (mnm(5)s(2)U34)-methyltransferase [Cerasicoccus arenae]|uniref:rRNA methyltransferase n=1 Tax=Cerasicoccus arenae TaxID=424488 RepID=A0A8J3GFC4_9BACT|nr:class I SAM-dependent methyltransferase [Cerasicoccus arenae]MBK1858479.1 class I SAM-dependent methyltransferase [Cerasicoccus arenae]GHC10400.1 rRNA methyltransferase [Cerasicoccus arenae]
MARLTQVAHTQLSDTIQAGDYAIDATAGNGHDTLLLARLVGSAGRVLAIDRQATALSTTQQRLTIASLLDRVILTEGDHANLLSLAPQDWQGHVQAIVFNLGYLPGSDKQIITTAATTRSALDACLQLLKPGGLLSLLIYRGHAGGHDEEVVILDWLETNANHFSSLTWNDGDFPTADSPRLLNGVISI